MARSEHPDSVAGRIVTGTTIGIGALVGTAAIAAGVITVIFARTVVTPPSKRTEDLRILAYDDTTITLSATIDSMTPGRYSLWFERDAGHARVGEIVSYSDSSVTRELLGVEFGDLATARRARLSGWFYLGPSELGFPFDDVTVETELGPAPAWLLPAASPSKRWVIGVHGRGVTRHEALRAVPVFREAGYTSLLVSYRNDGEAPRSPDHRYALGDTEWEDIEAAMAFAVENGAEQLVLMGWSMGGATVLQALTRSSLRDRVVGVVLESPVVDWVTALHYQGVARRLPRLVRLAVFGLLTRGWAGRLTGQAQPIDLNRLDFVTRATELHTPILLLHSDDDGYVPSTASHALAMARPDIVTFEQFTTARHTRLWNYDAERWNAVISRWLAGLR
ncbi:MAG: alpha/beta fold hydrolase [Rhodoglobus sp.]|nr:alpha/beta fold hydrolase [Rhodoglobus sp.]